MGGRAKIFPIGSSGSWLFKKESCRKSSAFIGLALGCILGSKEAPKDAAN
jgi:hypothetical protein